MDREPQIMCAARHTDGRGHSTPCPGYGAPSVDRQEQSEVWLLPARRQPVAHPYEARTVYGEIYDASADAVEQDTDWLTLWADGEISLRLPSSDLRALRRMDSGELPQANDDADESPLDEARMWARHGYEIGQRHCGWSDHGVAPAWLTDGWPRSFGTCEHLELAGKYDTALTQLRSVLGEVLNHFSDADADGPPMPAPTHMATKRIPVATVAQWYVALDRAVP